MTIGIKRYLKIVEVTIPTHLMHGDKTVHPALVDGDTIPVPLANTYGSSIGTVISVTKVW